MKTDFDDVKNLLTAHGEHFGALDRDLRSPKHHVNNNITVADGVIQGVQQEITTTTNEFKANSTELQTFCEAIMSHYKNCYLQ